jgi:hypothetical protein
MSYVDLVAHLLSLIAALLAVKAAHNNAGRQVAA